MNIIRTTAVELAAIPAIAYKQKLSAGGAGIKIFRLDTDASAVFSIDRRTGEAVPYGGGLAVFLAVALFLIWIAVPPVM